jgi:hypothetical protein
MTPAGREVRPDDGTSILDWVRAAPASPAVYLAQLLLVGWLGTSILVQVIPASAPASMGTVPASLYVLQWLVVTLWIPVAPLVFGRRRRGFLFAAALLTYSLAYQLLSDWLVWVGVFLTGSVVPDVGFPGARRALKLGLTLLSLVACLAVAPRQPE